MAVFTYNCTLHQSHINLMADPSAPRSLRRGMSPFELDLGITPKFEWLFAGGTPGAYWKHDTALRAEAPEFIKFRPNAQYCILAYPDQDLNNLSGKVFVRETEGPSGRSITALIADKSSKFHTVRAAALFTADHTFASAVGPFLAQIGSLLKPKLQEVQRQISAIPPALTEEGERAVITEHLLERDKNSPADTPTIPPAAEPAPIPEDDNASNGQLDEIENESTSDSEADDGELVREIPTYRTLPLYQAKQPDPPRQKKTSIDPPPVAMTRSGGRGGPGQEHFRSRRRRSRHARQAPGAWKPWLWHPSD